MARVAAGVATSDDVEPGVTLGVPTMATAAMDGAVVTPSPNVVVAEGLDALVTAKAAATTTSASPTMPRAASTPRDPRPPRRLETDVGLTGATSGRRLADGFGETAAPHLKQKAASLGNLEPHETQRPPLASVASGLELPDSGGRADAENVGPAAESAGCWAWTGCARSRSVVCCTRDADPFARPQL